MNTVHWMLPLIGSLVFGAMASAQNSDDIQFTSSRINCCTSSRITGLAEVLVLRPHESEGSAKTSQYNAAYRLSAGWMGHCGLGARVRWFEYSVETDREDYNLYGLDAEMTGDYQLGCSWNGLLALGVRHSNFEEVHDANVRAWGPSVTAELRRSLINNIDLFGSARYAILFGQDHEPGNDTRDITNAYSELQVGFECHRCLCGSRTLFVRAAAEGQHWNGSTDRDTEDFGLFGGTFAVGIAR